MSELTEYEAFVDDKAKWRASGKDVIYPAFGLAGEAGEVVDRLKKILRNADTPMAFKMAARRDEETLGELGDTLYYLTALAHDLGFTMQEVIDFNVEKLTERHKTAYYKIMERGDA